MTKRKFVEQFLLQMEARGWSYDILCDEEEQHTIYYLPLMKVVDEIFNLDEVTVIFRFNGYNSRFNEEVRVFFVTSNEGEEVLADYTNPEEVEKTLKGMEKLDEA